MQLHQDIEKFEEKKIKVIAICPEKIEGVKKYISKNTLAFDLVADNEHALGDKYGQKVNLLKLGRMPAQIILDKNGTSVFEYYSNSMADITENDQILNKF